MRLQPKMVATINLDDTKYAFVHVHDGQIESQWPF